MVYIPLTYINEKKKNTNWVEDLVIQITVDVQDVVSPYTFFFTILIQFRQKGFM